MIISKKKILYVSILFGLIFTSGHAFQTIFEGLSYIPLFGACYFVYVSFFKLKKVNKARFLLLTSFIIPLLFTMILDGGNNLFYYLFVVCGIIFAYGISLNVPFSKVVDLYLKIMTFVSIIALFGYVIYNNTNLLDFLPKIQNLNDKEYAIGLIFNALTHDPYRNCGMFWEPGLFATALTIAMIFEILFYEKKVNKFRILIFVLCFITANSSAGFILCFLCFSLFFVRNIVMRKKDILKIIISIIILLVFFLILYNLDNIILNSPLKENPYFDKLISNNIEESTRFLAVGHNLDIFIKYPIFGAGITFVNQNMQYVADTSTITHMMSIFGLVGIWYAIIWCIGILKIKNINIMSKIVLIIITMLILNKEPHLRLTFSWCLLFYLYIDTSNKNKIDFRKGMKK